MQSKYQQKLSLFGNNFTITYHYRESWQRILNGQLRTPVEVKVFPKGSEDESMLSQHLNRAEPDLLYIIREYLSTVKERFEGIRFDYELINHKIRVGEESGSVLYYRAELKWKYKY